VTIHPVPECDVMMSSDRAISLHDWTRPCPEILVEDVCTVLNMTDRLTEVAVR